MEPEPEKEPQQEEQPKDVNKKELIEFSPDQSRNLPIDGASVGGQTPKGSDAMPPVSPKSTKEEVKNEPEADAVKETKPETPKKPDPEAGEKKSGKLSAPSSEKRRKKSMAPQPIGNQSTRFDDLVCFDFLYFIHSNSPKIPVASKSDRSAICGEARETGQCFEVAGAGK